MKRKHKPILKDYKHFFKGRKKLDLKVSSNLGIKGELEILKVQNARIIEAQQKHISVLKARNARLWHDLRLMMSQQEEYMRKNIELIKSAKDLGKKF